MRTNPTKKWQSLLAIFMMMMFAGGLFANEANLPASIQQQIKLNKAKLSHFKTQNITKKGIKTGQMPKHIQQIESIKKKNMLSKQTIPNMVSKSALSVKSPVDFTPNTNASRDFFGFTLDDSLYVIGSDINATWMTTEESMYIYQFWDANNDGTLDEEDVLLDFYGPFEDNDVEDECPEAGTYCTTLDKRMLKNFNSITGDFIFVLTASQYLYEYDEQAVTFFAEEGAYTVSGTVTNMTTGAPMAGIPVWIDNNYYNGGTRDDDETMVITISDTLGYYELPVYEDGDYLVVADDYLHIYDNLIADIPINNLIIYADMPNIDFEFRTPLTSISGVVTFDSDPLFNVEIIADGGMLAERKGVVDMATGMYEILVDPGWYVVHPNPGTVLPIYMMPMMDYDFEIGPEGMTDVNFMLNETNAFISGVFYLDGVPFDGAKVFAVGEDHWTGYHTLNGGEFYLDVYDGEDGYMLFFKPPFQNVVVEYPPELIAPNTSGLIINAYTVNGGITGNFIDANTNEIIYDHVGLMAINLDNGEDYYAGPNMENGMYELYLPDGDYAIQAGGEFYGMFEDTVTIAGEMVPFDIILDSVTMDASIEGFVFDSDTEEPIPFAEIFIMSYDWGTILATDEAGHFYTDLPNGIYDIYLSAPGYLEQWQTFEVENNNLSLNFYLESFEVSGVLSGTTFDDMENPLSNVSIFIENEEHEFMTSSDMNGYYEIGLPAGEYHLEAWYYDMDITSWAWVDSFIIDGEDVNLDLYLEGENYSSAAFGIVVDGITGLPMPNAIVAATSNEIFEEEPPFWTMTNEAGEYWLDVDDGLYDLVAFAEGYELSIVPEVLFESDTLNYDFTIMPFAGAISGYVLDEDGYTIPDAGVVAFDELDTLGPGYYSETDEDGYYWIPVPNGVYTVMAGAEEYNIAWEDNIVVEDNEVTIDFTLYPFSNEWVAPQIDFLADQPNDQGRWVRMAFSPGHSEWEEPFEGYSIWRDVPDADCDCFDFVTYVPFHNEDMYHLVVPTLIDSNAYTTDNEMYWTGYKVSGHTGMYDFVDSEIMYGYSIDNILPMPVGGFALLNATADGVELVWDMVNDDDLQYYEVFRVVNGDLDNISSITMTGGLSYTDADVAIDNQYDYYVYAVDANGNMSETSDVVSTSLVSVDGSGIPSTFALNQNYPNPFNPTTNISFALPEQSHVELVIYNVRGQAIRTLTNTDMSAGYHTLTWDGLDNNGVLVGSGIYITTMHAGQFNSSNKMILLR